MKPAAAKLRQLEAHKIIETIESLQGRIQERFPGSGLGRIVGELLSAGRDSAERMRWLQRPHLPLRCGAGLLSLAIIALLVRMLMSIRQFQYEEYTNFIQALDASISSVVFIGAAILFLVSWETRIKRSYALEAIHELRALAHIIDMHQLTKDPETTFARGPQTTLLTRRTLTPFQLNRYLDYCSEAQALISKVAALYSQGFQDRVVLDAVDDVEDLTAAFSRKVWQKITILEMLGRSLPADPSRGGPDDEPPISEGVGPSPLPMI